jgi:DNA polymerase III subunit delta'
MTFEDIIGQEKAVARLKNYADTRALDGTYLFTGPSGVGKALTALAFAKAVNCLTDGAYGCDECVSCRKIEKGSHPDIHVIDSAAGQGEPDEDSSQIKISAIRAVQEDINYRPYEARKKVFIINNAHQLNLESANAFLKTLEEPPRDSLIILVTDRPSLLLPTVLSRCRVIKFYPLERSALEKILLGHPDAGRDRDPAEAHFLAYFSEGSLGTALRLKSSGMYEEKNKVINLFCGLGSHDQDAVSLASRQDLLTSFNILASWFRDIYLIKTGAADQIINSDRQKELASLTQAYSFGELDRIFAVLSESVMHVGRNLNKKLLVSNVIVSCKPSLAALA